jgi:hypothetical protein
MASIANIQAYDVSPILQQQAQDAALFQRDQATKAELQAKREQLAASMHKDMLKYRSDVQEKIDRAVTNGNLPKAASDWFISQAVPKVKKYLDEGNFLAADQEASNGIMTATQYGNVIKEKQGMNKQMAAQLAQQGINPEAFEAELTKRSLFTDKGDWKSFEEIANDKNDYIHDVLFNGTNPNIFAPMTDLGLGKGTKEQEIDITDDKGYSGVREKVKAKMPWYMKFDRITKTFDIDPSVSDLLYQQTVEANDAKRARYSRAARAEGLTDAAQIDKRMKELFLADVKSQAVTDYQYIKQDNFSDTAAMRLAGMISNSGSKSSKTTGPNSIDYIVGALSTDGGYLQDMPMLESVKGYNSPVVDVTAKMPKGGLIIGRQDKKPVIADQVVVDPKNQAVIVWSKDGTSSPKMKVFKGNSMVELLKQVPGFNAIKGGDQSFDRAFDINGKLKLDKDLEGESYFNDRVAADRANKVSNAQTAIKNFDGQNIGELSNILKGRTLVTKIDGKKQTFTIKDIKRVNKGMFQPDRFVVYVDGRKDPIYFTGTEDDAEAFSQSLLKTVR